MIKAVLDTNQFVSSLLSKKGPQSQILEAWQAGRFQVVISPAIIEEIARVLCYPKISTKYGILANDVAKLVGLIQKQAKIVGGLTPVCIIDTDPADNAVLACALEGKADFIVSGDSHLLDLKHFENIPVITGRQFLDILSREKNDDSRG